MIKIADRLSHLPLEVIRSLFDPSQNTLDLTVKTLYEPGQEVFNTYGEGMSWAKQACEWGFIDVSIEGEGVLGHSLKWEVGDIMNRDKEHHEKIKKAWKSQCKMWTDLTPAPSNASVKNGMEGGGDSLFFTPEEGVSPKDALLINDDAQVAFPLFWAVTSELELAFSKQEMLAIPQALNAAFHKLPDRQGHAGETDDVRAKQSLGGATRKKLREVSGGILRLFENRSARTWQGDASTSFLCDQLDDVRFLACVSSAQTKANPLLHNHSYPILVIDSSEWPLKFWFRNAGYSRLRELYGKICERSFSDII
jgi:hypothetical protein